MAPRESPSNQIRPTGILNENDAETVDGALLKPEGRIAKLRSYNLVWRNIILMSILHLMALYGGWLLFTGKTKWQTVLFGNYFDKKNAQLLMDSSKQLTVFTSHQAWVSRQACIGCGRMELTKPNGLCD